MSRSRFRIYDINNVAAFKKTTEIYGGLSNMASGFPIIINSVTILSSEALYQACRYPDYPEIQKLIIQQRSPMAANMISKQEVNKSRPDWISVRVSVMKWCLRVKMAQNWDTFSELLESTTDIPIVEVSNIDEFWGCKVKENKLLGVNALGRLLMELREYCRSSEAELCNGVKPLNISNFKLFGEDVDFVSRKDTNFQQRKLL